MAPSHSTSKRKTVLPLHIDTASFLSPPQHTASTTTTLLNAIYHPINAWRRCSHKRQVTLLFMLLIMSLGWNLLQYNVRYQYGGTNGWGKASGRESFGGGSTTRWNDPLPPAPFPTHHHAIVVTGHAMYLGPTNNITGIDDERLWILEAYQHGQVATFLNHIQSGIDLLLSDPRSLLIFSGGQTRLSAGPFSEGSSYWQIAQILLEKRQKQQNEEQQTSNIDTDKETQLTRLSERMIVEEYARDSYENVLFSLCRFSEMTSYYPTKLTVIGFEFKRQRFEQLHIPAIRYPLDRFNYIGIDPPFFTASDNIDNQGQPQRDPRIGHSAEAVRQSEVYNSFKPFQTDPYGCHGSLRQKRIDRNPYRRRSPYRSTCPIMAPLLDYCPTDNTIFSGPLPWSS